jgi:tetrahydromethanopterin S-methyltransferase subunit A
MEVKAMGRLMQSIYCEKNKEKHVIRMFKKRGVIKYIEYDKDYIDIYKTKQAFFVNTVHFIDSGIAYNIIKEFKEKGKGIFCVHDCFGVLEKEEKEIEKVYIKVFKGGEQEIRLENYYKNILESKKKEIKGIRRKEREEIEEE